MGDMGDAWDGYRQAQQARRRLRLPARQNEIEALRGKGYAVVKLTEFHYRIDGVLDLYPTHRRFHHLRSGRRGGYQNALACAVTQLRATGVN